MATNNNRGRIGQTSRRSSAPQSRQVTRPSVTSSRAQSRSLKPNKRSRSAEYESRTIGEINRSSRSRSRAHSQRSEERAAKPTNTWAKRVKIGVIVVAVLAVTLVGAYGACRFARVFPLNTISIQGADHLTDDEKAALAQIPENSSLLDVDQATIRANFLRDAWVKDVSVNVVLPDTLVVNVIEREVGAIVEMKSADSSSVTNWALSTDDVWLMPIPSRDSEAGQRTSSRIYEDVDSAVHITNVPYSTNPQIGATCTDSNVNNAVAILSGMTTELANQVKSVSATDAESTTLLLQNGVEIAFGAATDIRAKERVCLELLKEHEGEITYINVRTVSKPTWRSL